ncbi:hypothetical protein SteCoe_14969 [Stentor coeruleus]|uniref:Cyclic nucleotide-binding domain-containing protein n=1 Tax=Stentor coeruleus TaxID=5963 RepID=A0A1R2C4N0_9CILI|nr:hypothetical protein SteCoe_14969 [Stentor coeruleus]
MMRNIKLFGPRTLSCIDPSESISDVLTKHQNLIKSVKTTSEAIIVPIYMFHPSEGFKVYWNLILGLSLLYTAIVTPFLLAFIISREFDDWFVIDCILTGVFIFDVIITLNTAYIDDEGKLICSRKQIFMKYLKGWLIIDIVACIPFDLIQYSINPNGQRATYNTLSKLVRLKSLPRLFRLSKILVLFKQAKSFPLLDNLYYFFSLSNSRVQMISTFSMILLSLHIISCLWFYEFDPDTWISRQGMIDSELFDLYLTSIYWALTTLGTFGYGDITPKTTGELLLAMLWMVVAIYFLSFAISSLSSLISSNEEGKRKILDKRLALIDNYAEENRITRKVKQKMQKYVKETFDKDEYSFSETIELLNYFSIPLRIEIAQNLHHNAVFIFDLFQNAEERFVYTIIPLLRTEYYISGDYVYTEGELSKEIYFVISGKGHFVSSEKFRFKVLCPGHYFGDIEVVKKIKRDFSVRAAEDTKIWKMSQDVIKIIEIEFHYVFEEMVNAVDKRDHRMLMDLAEMRAINKASESGNSNLKNIRKLITEEYQKLVIQQETQKTEQDDISRIELKLEHCKNFIQKNSTLLEDIEKSLERLCNS